ncbi:MAG: hypothetical protein HYZ95_01190 [Candidatus Omnitrophica bacterium]|nr:hypothetical protein [Candidatus Omnitrophota bacterium]
MSRVSVWLLSVIVLGGCAAGQTASPARREPSPGRASPPCLLTAKPALRKQPVGWHLFDVTVLSQIEQGFHPGRIGRRLAGSPLPAGNFSDGTVADSSFFTNRDIARMTPADVRWGPTQPSQLATPPFTITKIKDEGKTAGFFVTDAKGRRFLLKLDVAGYPDLVTGAEVVTSKLLHLLGYYVPSYEIVEMAVEDLAVSERVEDGEEELREHLEGRLRDGRFRASASRLLDGEVLGPFRFKQHRDCAECRALKVACAWVNHTDTKDHNTLMVWTGTQAVGYLIDFGTSLGADAARGPKRPCQGWHYDVDLPHAAAELLTFGLHDDGCSAQEPVISQAGGRFPSAFDPRHWKPYAPNLAFEELTEPEARWMAARIAQVSRPQLEAAVASGAYHDPQDAERLVEILQRRQQAIVKAYLPEASR